MRLAVATLLAWAGLCAGAHASTVAVLQPYPSSPSRLDLLAAPGERNDVQFDPGTEPRTLRVRDAAGLTAEAPCVAQDAQTAICPVPGHLHVELRDGDDRLTGTGTTFALVVGGDGNDELRWTTGRLDGGPGDDVLSGRDVDGGPGNDVLEGEKLLYAAREQAVTVDLVAGTAGAVGELDRVGGGVSAVQTGPGADVIRLGDAKVTADTGAGDDTVTAGAAPANVEAGPGNDTLSGGAGADRLVGGEGDDRIEGGAGNDDLAGGKGDDTLVGGAGTDRLHGNEGRDRIDARDDRRERVSCNSDPYDPVLTGDVGVLDARDGQQLCEFVERSGPQRLEPIAVRLVSGTRRVLVSCPARAPARACAGTVRVPGDRVRAFRVEPGRRAHLAVRPRRGSASYRVVIVLRSGPTLRVSLTSVPRL